MGSLAALAAEVIALFAQAAIGALIGAVFLRAACWLYNKMAGGQKSLSGVPEPRYWTAARIALFVNLAVGTIRLVIYIAMVELEAAGGKDRGALLVSALVSLPVGYLVMAGLLTSMLPTTFPRALLVALLYWIIAIVVIGIAIAIIAAIFGAAMFGLGGR